MESDSIDISFISKSSCFVGEFLRTETPPVGAESLVDETKKMSIGDPLDRSTAHGPQNHRAHLEKLVEYCETGVKEG